MNGNSAGRCVRVLVLAAGVAGAVPVWGQTSLTDAPGTWKPWKPMATASSVRQMSAATPPLLRAFETELLALNAILRRASGVASPVGFSVETWGSVAGYHVAEHAPGQPAAAGVPLAGELTFGAFPIFEYERNGKTIRSDTGETALQQFHVNQIAGFLIGHRGNVSEWGPVHTDAYLEPVRQGEIAGLPRYGDGLVVARDPAALWTPLSHGAALDLVVKARDLEMAAAQENVDALTARLTVVRDPAWRAKRVKDAQMVAAVAPDPAAYVRQVEASIGIEEAAVVADLDRTGGAGKRLIDVRRALKEVTDWIAELSPAQLAAPSCYADKATTFRARFGTVASAACHPLVRPNYGYFNKTLPRSAPQVLIITPITRCFDTANRFNGEANSPSPAGCRANRALIETLDKDAIRAWLR
jgi:hypothetical protein